MEKMRLLLIFILLNISVCSKAERREKRGAPFHQVMFYRICRMFTEEGTKFQECHDCTRQALAQIETEKSSEEDHNEMSKSNILKTKEVVIKCSNYLTESEKLIECTKLDEAELISCVKRVFPIGQKKEVASMFCHWTDKEEECRQCLLDSSKNVWGKNNKKTEKRDASEDELKELWEKEATEMANNCNHYYINKNMVKKCATKEFGERMECLEGAVVSDYRDNLIFKLCSYSKETSMLEDCDNCVAEAIYTEDEVNYHDEVQKKEGCKKALEKSGQYIERQEEMMECTNIEDEEMEFCFFEVFEKINQKKLAIKMCKQTDKSDECVECVCQSLENAVSVFYNSSDSEEDPVYHLDRLEFTEITTNCQQHFGKEEELKPCREEIYGGMMDCMMKVLSIDKE